MSMTKSEFQRALRKAAVKEFEDIPTDCNYQHSYSQKYTKSMKSLLKKEKTILWKLSNTFSKKMMIVLSAFVLFIGFTSNSLAFSNNVIQIIIQSCEKCYSYIFQGDGRSVISTEYVISQIPSDFTQTFYDSSNNAIYSIFQDSNDRAIHYLQSITDNADISIDNEQWAYDVLIVDDIEIFHYSKSELSLLNWTFDGYYFSLTFYGSFADAEVLSIIENITKKE